MLTDKCRQRSDMEIEIWEILKAIDEKKLTIIEAHKKLCGLYIVSGTCRGCDWIDIDYKVRQCVKCKKTEQLN